MGVDKKSKAVQKRHFSKKDVKPLKGKAHTSKLVNKITTNNEISNKKIDVDNIEDQLSKLQNMESTKKIRKKIRQLEFLKRRYIQMQNMKDVLQLKNDNEDEASQNEIDSTEAMDEDNEKNEESDTNNDEKSDAMKGIKRFVVFVGNLAKSVTEENLRSHFSKVGEIKSIRIPEPKENRKSGFAFIEVTDNISFEKTLSMHHTMLHNKRINVLYTNPDGKNLDRKEIRKKNAKFDAMRKAGLLTGSVPEHKKRSFRRKKKKMAEEKAASARKNI